MTRSLTDSVRATGYDREEEFIHRLEQEQRDAERKASLALGRRCPDCGAVLQSPPQTAAIPGNVCQECGGVFLSKEHLEAISRSGETHPLRDYARRLLAALTRPRPTGIGQFPV